MTNGKNKQIIGALICIYFYIITDERRMKFPHKIYPYKMIKLLLKN